MLAQISHMTVDRGVKRLSIDGNFLRQKRIGDFECSVVIKRHYANVRTKTFLRFSLSRRQASANKKIGIISAFRRFAWMERTGLMGAVRPQTPHRSPRQAFGGNQEEAVLRTAQEVLAQLA